MIHTIFSLLPAHILADDQAPTGIQSIFGNQFIMIGLLFVMMYFLMIRPQVKQRKEQAARMEAIEQGDKVVTTAGIHGLVHNVKDHTIVVKVAEGTMIEFDKAAIAVLHKKDAPAAK